MNKAWTLVLGASVLLGCGVGDDTRLKRTPARSAVSAGSRRMVVTPVVFERVIRGRVNVGALEDESGSGAFDPSIVAGLIRPRIRAIQTCYERELRNNPTLSGRVLVRFTIQTSGSVSGASATENTTGSPAVAACVVRNISRFRFDPGPEGGSVSFACPFVFAPAAAPDTQLREAQPREALESGSPGGRRRWYD